MVGMLDFPKDPKKIQARIRRYERKFRAEKADYGMISDGAGKRYLLGPLYLLMSDLEGAIDAYRWYEDEFPDDTGEAGNHLCWSLALYRSGDNEGASAKLRQTMLLNLYVIPDLLGEQQEEIEMWHGCSRSEIEYLEYVPEEFLKLWHQPARDWAREQYESPEFQRVRDRFIAINKELLSLPRGGPERRALGKEIGRLKGR